MATSTGGRTSIVAERVQKKTCDETFKARGCRGSTIRARRDGERHIARGASTTEARTTGGRKGSADDNETIEGAVGTSSDGKRGTGGVRDEWPETMGRIVSSA